MRAPPLQFHLRVSCEECSFTHTGQKHGSVDGNTYTVPTDIDHRVAKQHARTTDHRRFTIVLDAPNEPIKVTQKRKFSDSDLRRPLLKRMLRRVRLE